MSAEYDTWPEADFPIALWPDPLLPLFLTDRKGLGDVYREGGSSTARAKLNPQQRIARMESELARLRRQMAEPSPAVAAPVKRGRGGRDL